MAIRERRFVINMFFEHVKLKMNFIASFLAGNKIAPKTCKVILVHIASFFIDNVKT